MLAKIAKLKAGKIYTSAQAADSKLHFIIDVAVWFFWFL
jgi:hypothetical protein